MIPISNGSKVIAWLKDDKIYSSKGKWIGQISGNTISINGEFTGTLSGNSIIDDKGREFAMILNASDQMKIGVPHDIKSFKKPRVHFSPDISAKDAQSFLHEMGNHSLPKAFDNLDFPAIYKQARKWIKYPLIALLLLAVIDYVRYKFSSNSKDQSSKDHHSLEYIKTLEAEILNEKKRIEQAAINDVKHNSEELHHYLSKQSVKPTSTPHAHATTKQSSPSPTPTRAPQQTSTKATASETGQPSAKFSPLKRIDKISTTDVYQTEALGQDVLVFETGLNIDADGSPRAYGPSGTKALDYLANAGHPGNWWGIVADQSGNPVIQGENDPYPGYYVSTTSLQNFKYKEEDPRRYVDSEKVPFFVLPLDESKKMDGVKLGDFGVVWNRRKNIHNYCIIADIGPRNQIGEGSVSLAKNLGINSDAKVGGQSKEVVFYLFPNSGDGQYKTVQEIYDSVHKIEKKLGGFDKLKELWSSHLNDQENLTP